MLSWFTGAFTKPFAALTLLDLIKAFMAWCGALFLLVGFIGSCVGEWETWKESRRKRLADRDPAALDDQGRPYD